MLEGSDKSEEADSVRKAYKAGLLMRSEFNARFSNDIEKELSKFGNNAKALNRLLRKGVKELGGEVRSVPVGHEKLYSDKEKMNAHPSALIYNRGDDSSTKEDFVIYTPEGDHPEVENWIIAFELGHYFLHKREEDWYMGGKADVPDYFNDQAAAFSVAFLLPDEEVEKKYRSLKEIYKDTNKIISELSNYFGVWDDITRRHVKKKRYYKKAYKENLTHI